MHHLQHNANRIIAVIASIGFVITLQTGCRSDNTIEQRDKPDELHAGVPFGYDTDGFVFVPEYLALPEDIGIIRHLAHYENTIYFAAAKDNQHSNSNNDVEYYTTVDKIYSVDIYNYGSNPPVLSSSPVELSDYTLPSIIPADISGEARIDNIITDTDGNLWVAESWNSYSFTLPSDFDIEHDDPWDYREYVDFGYCMRMLDAATGAELMYIDLSTLNIKQRTPFIDTITVDSMQYIYLGIMNIERDAASVYVLNNSSQLLFQYDFNAEDIEFTKSDDAVYAVVMTYDNSPGSNAINRLELNNITGRVSEQPIYVTSEIMSTVTGSGRERVIQGSGKLNILLFNTDSLFGYSLDYETVHKLLDWRDSNINGSTIEEVLVISDEHIICLSIEEKDGTWQQTDLIVLTKVPQADVPQVTVLTLATHGLSQELNSAIIRFNNRNPHYRIEVNDYSQLWNADDRLAGYNQLNLDIISGSIPDILNVDNGIFDNYAQAGLFTNLYTLIDADPLISRDDIIPAVLEAIEVDGNLYYLAAGFSMSTVLGSASAVGSGTGWDIDEFTSVLSNYPDADLPMGPEVTSGSFIINSIINGINDFINWDSGVVSFNTPDFIKLLDLSQRFPISNAFAIEVSPGLFILEDYDERNIVQSGRQILSVVNLNSFNSIRYYNMLYDGEVVYKGYPNKNGNVLYIHTYEDCLAITNNSQHKEVAWEFVKTLLSSDWQIDNIERQFPTNSSAFAQRAEAAQNPRTDGIREGMGGYQSLDLASQEDIDIIYSLLKSASARADIDDVLRNILMECISDYINGVTTAEETADILQSKVSIYVSERY